MPPRDAPRRPFTVQFAVLASLPAVCVDILAVAAAERLATSVSQVGGGEGFNRCLFVSRLTQEVMGAWTFARYVD